VEMVIFFKEMEPGVFRVSLRSKGRANSALVAESYGGGGHMHAAGFTVHGEYEKLWQEIPLAVEEILSKIEPSAESLSSMPTMDGLIVIDKPAGLTSHQVVLKLRNTLRVRRIGHAGTLDPLATGVLLVTVGQATRFFPYLSSFDKTYTGKIRLGLATNTYDSEGQPEGPERQDFPDEKKLLESIAFCREVIQFPPPFSAKKINGQPAFKLARQGLRPALNPIRVIIHSSWSLIIARRSSSSWSNARQGLTSAHWPMTSVRS